VWWSRDTFAWRCARVSRHVLASNDFNILQLCLIAVLVCVYNTSVCTRALFIDIETPLAAKSPQRVPLHTHMLLPWLPLCGFLKHVTVCGATESVMAGLPGVAICGVVCCARGRLHLQNMPGCLLRDEHMQLVMSTHAMQTSSHLVCTPAYTLGALRLGHTCRCA
jgi:hypothetical protein